MANSRDEQIASEDFYAIHVIKNHGVPATPEDFLTLMRDCLIDAVLCAHQDFLESRPFRDLTRRLQNESDVYERLVEKLQAELFKNDPNGDRVLLFAAYFVVFGHINPLKKLIDLPGFDIAWLRYVINASMANVRERFENVCKTEKLSNPKKVVDAFVRLCDTRRDPFRKALFAHLQGKFALMKGDTVFDVLLSVPYERDPAYINLLLDCIKPKLANAKIPPRLLYYLRGMKKAKHQYPFAYHENVDHIFKELYSKKAVQEEKKEPPRPVPALPAPEYSTDELTLLFGVGMIPLHALSMSALKFICEATLGHALKTADAFAIERAHQDVSALQIPAERNERIRFVLSTAQWALTLFQTTEYVEMKLQEKKQYTLSSAKKSVSKKLMQDDATYYQTNIRSTPTK